MLIEEEAVPRRLLLVLHLMPEHADVLNSLLLILLMLTAKPRNLILEEAVLHSLLLVLHVTTEHAHVLNRLSLFHLMLTAKPRKLILEEAVPYSLHSLFHVGTENADVLHSLFLILLMLTETPTDMMADDADVDVDVVLMRSLLLMPRSLRHMLNGLLLVPRSLLLVLQMFRANASSQQYSCKGRGFSHVWHTLKFPPLPALGQTTFTA